MPDLTVYLGGLTEAYIGNVYMTIEYPETGPITAPPQQETIGQFYDAISVALAQVAPPFSGNDQMAATIGENSLTPVLNLADAQNAISTIKEQGEGTSTSPDDGAGTELAHYYRFGEIYNGAELVLVNGKWQYTGTPVPFPSTYPMAAVPKGGWPNPPSNVTALLQQFDGAFSSIIDLLQAAWQNGSQTDLDKAIGEMFSLSGPAIQLMQIPLSGGRGATTGRTSFIQPPRSARGRRCPFCRGRSGLLQYCGLGTLRGSAREAPSRTETLPGGPVPDQASSTGEGTDGSRAAVEARAADLFRFEEGDGGVELVGPVRRQRGPQAPLLLSGH